MAPGDDWQLLDDSNHVVAPGIGPHADNPLARAQHRLRLQLSSGDDSPLRGSGRLSCWSGHWSVCG